MLHNFDVLELALYLSSISYKIFAFPIFPVSYLSLNSCLQKINSVENTGYNRLYYILLVRRISCLTTNSKGPNKHFELQFFLQSLLCFNWTFFSNTSLSINFIFRGDKCRHLSAPPNCSKLVSSNISRSSYRLFITIMHTSEKTYARPHAGFIISENQLK